MQTKTPPPTITATFPPTGTPTITYTPTLPKPQRRNLKTIPVIFGVDEFLREWKDPKSTYVEYYDNLPFDFAKTIDEAYLHGVIPLFPATGHNPELVYDKDSKLKLSYFDHQNYEYPKCWPRFVGFIHTKYEGEEVVYTGMLIPRYGENGRFVEAKTLTVIMGTENKINILTEY